MTIASEQFKKRPINNKPWGDCVSRLWILLLVFQRDPRAVLWLSPFWKQARLNPHCFWSVVSHKWENKMAASSLSLFCARSLFLFPSQKLRCFCTQGDSHTIHVPVMLKECLSFLAPRDGQVSHEVFTAGYSRFTVKFATIVFTLQASLSIA